ncbi:MAG: hypothetical protein FWD62_02120 [Betaproteobacteria bacterium]|nr:hypothetical protein [Betaproteobacteria bacterium]
MDVLTFAWAGTALAVLVLELLLGTIYLLAWTVGLATGGLLQWLTGSWSLAAMVAAAVTAAGSVVAHRVRRQVRLGEKMRDVDWGGEARLLRPLGAGRWRVAFRGTEWDARIESGSERAAPDALGKICGREANLLVLKLD